MITQEPTKVAVQHAHHSLIPHWIRHLGALGLFAVAVADSSAVPLPIPGSTDLLLLWLVSHKGNPWLLAASAITGSLVGGYLTWCTGKRGGEAALRRYVDARWLTPISRWVESHSSLAVFIPALLPPPFPLTPFILSAGAFGVSRKRFLQVFGLARSLRYTAVTWLGFTYGRGIVRAWSAEVTKWSPLFLETFATIAVLGIIAAIWNIRQQHSSQYVRA